MFMARKTKRAIFREFRFLLLKESDASDASQRPRMEKKVLKTWKFSDKEEDRVQLELRHMPSSQSYCYAFEDVNQNLSLGTSKDRLYFEGNQTWTNGTHFYNGHKTTTEDLATMQLPDRVKKVVEECDAKQKKYLVGAKQDDKETKVLKTWTLSDKYEDKISLILVNLPERSACYYAFEGQRRLLDLEANTDFLSWSMPTKSWKTASYYYYEGKKTAVELASVQLPACVKKVVEECGAKLRKSYAAREQKAIAHGSMSRAEGDETSSSSMDDGSYEPSKNQYSATSPSYSPASPSYSPTSPGVVDRKEEYVPTSPGHNPFGEEEEEKENPHPGLILRDNFLYPEKKEESPKFLPPPKLSQPAPIPPPPSVAHLRPIPAPKKKPAKPWSAARRAAFERKRSALKEEDDAARRKRGSDYLDAKLGRTKEEKKAAEGNYYPEDDKDYPLLFPTAHALMKKKETEVLLAEIEANDKIIRDNAREIAQKRASSFEENLAKLKKPKRELVEYEEAQKEHDKLAEEERRIMLELQIVSQKVAAAKVVMEALKRELPQELLIRAATSAKKECRICFEESETSSLYISVPCGHRIACEDCAKRVFVKFGTCPLCSMKIEKIIPVFDS